MNIEELKKGNQYIKITDNCIGYRFTGKTTKIKNVGFNTYVRKAEFYMSGLSNATKELIQPKNIWLTFEEKNNLEFVNHLIVEQKN